MSKACKIVGYNSRQQFYEIRRNTLSFRAGGSCCSRPASDQEEHAKLPCGRKLL